MNDAVYFVHMSDTHIGPTADYERHGFRPLPCAKRMVEIINKLPQKPDFVIHTGDVVTDPDPTSYQQAADLLGKIDVPTYYVVGNHDTAAELKQYMTMGACEFLSDSLLTYRFEVKGRRFLVLDGRAPDEMDPRGLISDEQMRIVQDEIEQGTMPLTLFVHFPLVSLNIPWLEPEMMTENGEALHQVLKAGSARINGVFYGHIHQHSQVVRDGILYASAASTFSQFSGWPNELEASFLDTPPGYSFVQILDDRLVIQPHVFARP